MKIGSLLVLALLLGSSVVFAGDKLVITREIPAAADTEEVTFLSLRSSPYMATDNTWGECSFKYNSKFYSRKIASGSTFEITSFSSRQRELTPAEVVSQVEFLFGTKIKLEPTTTLEQIAEGLRTNLKIEPSGNMIGRTDYTIGLESMKTQKTYTVVCTLSSPTLKQIDVYKILKKNDSAISFLEDSDF